MKTRKIIFLLLLASYHYGLTQTKSVLDSIKTVELNSVEVVGNRPNNETPLTETTIAKPQIGSVYHGQEMTYILESTPSITTQSDGGQENGYTYFRIRGIDQTRINVTLDGVPLNEPEDQGAYYSNYPNFAMYLNSIQIQRGIGVSSNGTASYGGNINFELKNGDVAGGDNYEDRFQKAIDEIIKIS